MNGLHGGFDLVAASDARERTFLRRQAFSPPIHISKPHHDGGWLVVNLASPSPGLLAGDRVDARVVVERDARLLLTTPSANRVHDTGEGSAELMQAFEVHAGGMLDVWPEYLIPQAGARYRQRTKLSVAKGGTLLWTESIAPGRVAKGESFAFAELSLATDLIVQDELVARERYTLTPGNTGNLRAAFPAAYYAGILCASPMLVQAPLALRQLGVTKLSADIWMGATQIRPDVWCIKIVAADSPALRIAIGHVRRAIFQVLELQPAGLRRITAEVMTRT